MLLETLETVRSLSVAIIATDYFGVCMDEMELPTIFGFQLKPFQYNLIFTVITNHKTRRSSLAFANSFKHPIRIEIICERTKPYDRFVFIQNCIGTRGTGVD